MRLNTLSLAGLRSKINRFQYYSFIVNKAYNILSFAPQSVEKVTLLRNRKAHSSGRLVAFSTLLNQESENYIERLKEAVNEYIFEHSTATEFE